jgi:hypothetical protein
MPELLAPVLELLCMHHDNFVHNEGAVVFTAHATGEPMRCSADSGQSIYVATQDNSNGHARFG